MTPVDSLSQNTLFQKMVTRVLCNQKCVFKAWEGEVAGRLSTKMK